MSLSVKNIIAAIVPRNGDLIYNDNQISIPGNSDVIVAFHSTEKIQYSILDRTTSSNFIDVKWDHTGEFLYTLDDLFLLKIWKLGETIEKIDIIEKIQLSSNLSLNWYQNLKNVLNTNRFFLNKAKRKYPKLAPISSLAIFLYFTSKSMGSLKYSITTNKRS
jgi:hypothetical protein